MTRILFALILVVHLAIPTEAKEMNAPMVPESGQELMPQRTDSFGEALLELLQNSGKLLRPDLKEAAKVSSVILFSAMLFSLLPIMSERLNGIASLAGAVTIATVMLQHTNSLLCLASETVWEIFEYGKLLCPVLTASLAAQGGVAASSALYVGTMVFITLLSTLISKLLLPMISIFLAFAVASCALGDVLLKKAADAVKGVMGWLLKTLLVVFTTYMSITGVVSGTTDAAALKAAKVVISTAVPVVGGILSDSSESVLVSMGIVKNAAGIYGILAVLAIFLGPFLKIGAHYIILKVSAVLCCAFGNKNISSLASDFSSALGFLLAVIAAGCVLVLISTVCFLKGAA